MEHSQTDGAVIQKAKALYTLEGYAYRPVPGHEGGRNRIWICSRDGENRYVLRASALGDRTEEDYLAETEFVHYLAISGAPVADVILSVNGRMVESVEEEGKKVYIINILDDTNGNHKITTSYDGAVVEVPYLLNTETNDANYEIIDILRKELIYGTGK